MKKLYTLLMMCLLGTVVSWAETETVTVKSWDFVKYSDENCTHDSQVNIAYSTTQENEMYPGTGYADGLLFATNGVAWKYFYRTNNANSGLYSANGGGRNVAIKDVKAGDTVRITATAVALPTTATNGTYVTEKSSSTDAYYVVTADGYLTLNFTRYIYIRTITVTREVEAGTCENPSYKITGVDGEARKFTLACATTGASIFYSDKELEAGAEGWTAYEGEVTTGSTKIYAYASANGAKSEVINFETGAGSELTLNAPYANKTAYANGSYTVSIGSDQSSLAFAPSTVTYHYSIDGAAYVEGATATLPAGSTLTAYATAEGYTTSSITTCEASIRPTGVLVWTQDYTNLVSGSTGAQTITLTETEGGDFTVGDMAFYNITGYTGTEISELNTNVGLNTASYFYFRTNGNNSGILKNANNSGTTGYIGIQNLTPGQYIVITTNGNPLSATEGCEDNLGMNTTSEYYFTATATEASIFFQHGVYNYVKSISVLAPAEQITVNSTGVSSYVTTYALDFSEVEGLTALVATEETATEIKMEKVTEVPAGTPIIVRGTPGEIYTVPAGTCTELAKTNLLKGFTNQEFNVGTDATNTVYALKNTDGDFHKVATTVTIPAKIAFLESQFATSTEAKAMTIVGEEEENTTAITITTANEAKKSTKLYNAAGQQVDANYNGIVIDENGNKYIK